MKIFVYVEGKSDKLSLEELLGAYRQRLRQQRHGLAFVVLGSKNAFFRKLGPRAAANLADSDRNCVVALPDLYPNRPYSNTANAHATCQELCLRLTALVTTALADVYNLRAVRLEQATCRFHASALKHDLEMLLLAAWVRLGEQIGQRLNPSRWRHPVEDQDQDRPPKRVVEEIFRARTSRAYRDTLHAPAVLRRVADLDEILYQQNGQPECPVFSSFLDWVGARTGVTVC